MRRNGFEGWYFKHQIGDETVSFIPGRAKSGAFVQVITRDGAKQFSVPQLSRKNGVIHAGDCRFSMTGCHIELPGIRGDIAYGTPTPLKRDIMGPFRFFPMECRHGVLSMAHPLSGHLYTDGKKSCFDGGCGYIESDRGTSFPRSYVWLQCNDFSVPCALMLSIAHIPFGGLRFEGCICSVILDGREYRLATYNGVHICTARPDHICLSQRRLFLELDIHTADSGHPLSSPIKGQMRGVIRETTDAGIRLRLWENGRPLLDTRSNNAAYEYVLSAR